MSIAPGEDPSEPPLSPPLSPPPPPPPSPVLGPDQDPLLTYRTNAQVLDIYAHASISPPPPKYDPDVSLRSAERSDSPSRTTLSEFRESEGQARRLTRLRSVFDSLPPPPPATTTTSAAATESASTTTTPNEPPRNDSTTATEAERCARDQKAYLCELWGQCGSAVTTDPGPLPSTEAETTTELPAPETTAEPRATKTKRTASTTATRWKAFEQYAEAKERELWRAFCELDRDGDMRLRKPEVREACRRAGIDLREEALDEFVRTVDRDGDGAISFDDWRDFLLLLPRPISMKEIWRYWQTKRIERPSMSRLTQDGDVTVVIGRGRSGWRKLFGRTSSSSSSTTATSATTANTPPKPLSPRTTDLRQLEPINDEQRYMSACARMHADERERERKRQSAEAVSKAGQAGPSLEFEESGVVAAEPARTQPSPLETVPPELPQEEEEEELDATHDMFADAGKFLLAGGIAGAVSRTATAPFDRLKVFLITSPASKSATPPRGRPGAGTLVGAVKTVYRQGGGIKAFWTGNGLNIIKIFPESAIKFLSYESAKRVFAQYWDKVPDQTMISNSSRFVAGGIGGVASQLCIYPIEALKTRVMSSSGGAMRGNALILQTARDMWSRGRFRYFFRGLPAGLIGVFPYSAIDMSTFEGIKLAYTQWAGEEPGVAGSLAFGAISGGVGASSVYPLNLVRTRLQAQGTPSHPQTYTGIRDAAIKCYQLEGWRGFYKGLTPTLVKVVPAVAISYAVYDTSKKMLFAADDPASPELSSDSESDA